MGNTHTSRSNRNHHHRDTAGHHHHQSSDLRTRRLRRRHFQSHESGDNSDEPRIVTMEEKYKIILLGTGEGGKATLFKQILNLYQTTSASQSSTNATKSGSSSVDLGDQSSSLSSLSSRRQQSLFCIPEYRQSYTSIIHRNALLSMYNLCRGAMDRSLPIQNTEALQRIMDERDLCQEFEMWHLTPEVAQDIRTLWEQEESLHEMYQRRHELESFFESAKYWFDEIMRLAQPKYVPTLEDIMHMRVKTTGIVEQSIEFVDLKWMNRDSPGRHQGDAAPIGSGRLSARRNTRSHKRDEDKILLRKKKCSVILTGSQRNERRKWPEAWKDGDISAVLFVVSLSEYNQVLYEDGQTNRMVESLALFEEIVNSRVMHQVPIYLLFNKQDVFLEKIGYYDLSACPLWEDTLPSELSLTEPFNNFIPNLYAQKTKTILEQSRALKNTINRDASSSFDVEAMVQQLTKTSKSRSFLFGSRRQQQQQQQHFMSRSCSSNNLLSDSTNTEASFIISHYKRQSKQLTDDFLAQNDVQLLKDDDDDDDVMILSLGDHVGYDSVAFAESHLLSLPTDVLLQICLFLESEDLITLGMTCFEMFIVTSSDFVWRALTLSYHPLVTDDAVLRVFKSSDYYQDHYLNSGLYIDTDGRIAHIEPQHVAESEEQQDVQLQDNADQEVLSSVSSADHDDDAAPGIPFGIKTPWRYYYEYCENWYQRNLDFIVSQFMARTRRSDIQIFVTCAIDSHSLKPVLDTIMHEVIFEHDGFPIQPSPNSSTSPQQNSNSRKNSRR